MPLVTGVCNPPAGGKQRLPRPLAPLAQAGETLMAEGHGPGPCCGEPEERRRGRGGHEGCPGIKAQGLTFGEICGEETHADTQPQGGSPACGVSATEGSLETGTLTLGSLMRHLSS